MTEPIALDPRLHLISKPLAASRYRGLVEAARFADPVTFQVTAGVCPIRKAPAFDAEQLSQALHGERIDILDETDGFGWGQSLEDGYVGWFDMAALSAPADPVTHRVTALRTYGYSGPGVKHPPHFLLSLNATVSVKTVSDNGFADCGRGVWVSTRHLAPLGEAFETDPVAVAERFLASPYQWGGKESLGLDCSALVQMAWLACGIRLPRDSDMQRAIGEAVPVGDDLKGLQRGDIVCWDGHVAIMLDSARIIHANATTVNTAIEPLAAVRDRIAAVYGPLLSVRRLG
jgi:cell wall-associated NlpC family hydrolase